MTNLTSFAADHTDRAAADLRVAITAELAGTGKEGSEDGEHG